MTAQPEQAVLAIYILNKGLTPQGKFCYVNGKPFFVANMTEAKWWRNFTGYAIAKRILDAFSKLKISPTIVFKREDKNQYYLAKRTTFWKKGIPIAYGGHSQIVLPMKNWIFKAGKFLGEPMDLPVMNIDDWMKTAVPRGSSKPIDNLVKEKLNFQQSWCSI